MKRVRRAGRKWIDLGQFMYLSNIFLSAQPKAVTYSTIEKAAYVQVGPSTAHPSLSSS